MGSNISQFIADTNKEIKKLQDKQVREAKTIVLGAYNSILLRSPVDTGLFKNNNIITYNEKANSSNLQLSLTKKGVERKVTLNDTKNKNVVNKAKFKHGDTLTIQNNLVYADALEAGHSKQAPKDPAIYGATEQIIRRQLAKRIKI